MDIALTSAGKLMHQWPQQSWYGESPEIMQTSRFAGQEMIAIQKSDDEPEIYELHYMGFAVSGFVGIVAAKDKAPAFAKKVLINLSEQILE